MIKDRSSGTWFRFAVMEMYALLLQRRWLFTIVFLGLYSAFAGSQVARTYLLEHQPLLGWQIFTLMFGGPFPRASVMELLKWVSLPAVFLLTVGEPFSELAAPWNRLAIIRMPSRRLCWWGKVTAWYGIGFLFTILVMGLGILAEILLLRIGCWKLPPLLTLGEGAARSPSLSVIIWVALGLLSAVWWYTALLFTASLASPRAGMATVVTICTGYVVAIAGANFPQISPFAGPALGATLNAQAFAGGILDGIVFFKAGLVLSLWLAAGLTGGYLALRKRIL